MHNKHMQGSVSRLRLGKRGEREGFKKNGLGPKKVGKIGSTVMNDVRNSMFCSPVSCRGRARMDTCNYLG